MNDERYAIALEEARRAMDQQRSDLAGIRERAGSLLGFAGLAGAFVGGLVIRDDAKMSAWTWIAVLAFTLLAVVVLYALKPRRFTLILDSPKLVSWIEDDNADLDKLRRDTALWLDAHHTKNQQTLNKMYKAYLVGIILLLVEVCALLLDLRGK